MYKNPPLHEPTEIEKAINYFQLSDRVLLRVRLLYYLRQEVIGDSAEKILSNCDWEEAGLNIPPTDGEPPTTWYVR